MCKTTVYMSKIDACNAAKIKLKNNKTIYLKLEEHEDYINLVAFPEEGCFSCGDIIQINNEGLMYRCMSVDEKTGLQLEEGRRIKIDKMKQITGYTHVIYFFFEFILNGLKGLDKFFSQLRDWLIKINENE